MMTKDLTVTEAIGTIRARLARDPRDLARSILDTLGDHVEQSHQRLVIEVVLAGPEGDQVPTGCQITRVGPEAPSEPPKAPRALTRLVSQRTWDLRALQRQLKALPISRQAEALEVEARVYQYGKATQDNPGT